MIYLTLYFINLHEHTQKKIKFQRHPILGTADSF